MGDRATAVALHNEAVKAVLDKQHAEYQSQAYALFSSACYADPSWSSAWYQCGCNGSDIATQQKNNEILYSAIACYRRALQCEEAVPGERAKTYANLGWRLHSVGDPVAGMKAVEESIRLDKSLHLAWVTKSLIHGTLGQVAASYDAARIAFDLNPDAESEMALTFACLFSGRYAEGFKHNERRFEWRLHKYQHLPYKTWNGESDGVVFLSADQGMGDTLSFARFLRQAASRAKFIHVALQAELLRLFQHAFVDVPNLNLMPNPCPFPAADYWTTFFSLPHALGLTDEEIRTAPPIDYPRYKTDERSWKVPDRKFHIGIAWAGSPLNDIDAHRNIPFWQFLDLYRVPGIQLYSLQIGDRAKDLENFGGAPLVRRLDPYIRDCVDTLTFINQLDLVITVESALGHLCATAGKEAWIPYSYRGKDWRLGYRGENLLWCPHTKVFLQDESCTWQPVFDQIVEMLRGRVK